MKVIIEADGKEIAALILALQEQRKDQELPNYLPSATTAE